MQHRHPSPHELQQKMRYANQKLMEFACLEYKSRRQGHWIVRGSNGLIYPLFLYWYDWRTPTLRLSLAHVSFPPQSISVERRARLVKDKSFEISFSPDESEVVIPWILSHLVEPVSVRPPWLSPSWAHDIVIGEPLSGYHWTKKAKEAHHLPDNAVDWFKMAGL